MVCVEMVFELAVIGVFFTFLGYSGYKIFPRVTFVVFLVIQFICTLIQMFNYKKGVKSALDFVVLLYLPDYSIVVDSQ
jgi:hypothetical protein